MSKLEKMQYCDYCGKELGVYVRYGRDIDTCGARECERFARDQDAMERDEAHEQLDRDRGWR